MDTDTNKDITFFAKTNFRNKEVPFGIKVDDRRRHMYVIGKTGMGKTTLMENMIIQDIVNGHGIAFVDPHGDSVEKILEYIPSNRVNDVIYFNPSDMDFPIAFNILETVDPRYKHLVASGLMGVFTKIWAGTWSARMEYILNNTILALLDSPGNTLLGISRMFLDKKYRKKIVDNVKDPMVRTFWQDEYANWQEKYRAEAVAPIQNKVGQFLSSSMIRNIVGQPKSTVDLREVMDNRKILLLNLSKGRIGEDNSALLGAMIITKLQLAALSRVDIDETERKDFYLYVDEFQNFATESFATILSEARKYRLNLTIGHQYIGQLVQEKNTKVRDAVFGNVGTIITFRVGAGDAEFLEKEFAPGFTENDLVNLPKHTILLKLMINGVASDPFTAVTLPPTHYQKTGNMEKVIRISRERYANPADQVDEKIIKWMGQDIHEEAAIIASHVGNNQDVEPVFVKEKKEQERAVSQPLAVNDVEKIVTDFNSVENIVTQQPQQMYMPPLAEELDVPQDIGNFNEESQPVFGNAQEAPIYRDPEPLEQPKRIVRPQTHSAQQPRSQNAGPQHSQNNKNRNNFGNGAGSRDAYRGPERRKPFSNNRQPAKKDNPIWGTVAKLTTEKQVQKKQIIESLSRDLHKENKPVQNNFEITQETRIQETRAVEQKTINNQQTILKPGETHKIDNG